MTSTKAASFLPAVFAATLALPLALSGCDKGGDDAAAAEAGKQEEEELPNIDVNLPPAPDFEEGKMDEKHPDGAYSIYGLRENLDARLEEGAAQAEIEVKGYVQEIYVPPECPEGEFCAPGKQPHVWITDKPDQQGKKRAMMVVAYRFAIAEWDAERWEGQPEVILEKGQQYTFKGKFVRFSSTGFAHDSGLLEFVAYKAPDEETGEMKWVYPPGAAWHPLEVARVEEMNKKAQEDQAKAAELRKKAAEGGEE